MHTIPRTDGMTRKRRDHVVRTVVAKAAEQESPESSGEPTIPTGPGCTTMAATRGYIAARCAYLGKPATLILLLDPIAKATKRRFWLTHWYNAHSLACEGELLDCGEGTLGASLYWLECPAEEGTVA